MIDNDNLLPSNLIQIDEVTTLNTTISDIMTDLDGKQDTITSSHKLSSSNVDYSTCSLRFVDITSSLQTQLDSISSGGGVEVVILLLHMIVEQLQQPLQIQLLLIH